jgi:hypothetical protein
MNQEQVSSLPLQRVVGEAIDALTHLDADRLEALERSVEAVKGKPLAGNVTDVVTNVRILGRLLEETRKNLHVFKLLDARRHHQEDTQGYAGIPSAR